MGGEESGIKRVVEAYHKYMPEFDIEYVDSPDVSYDIKAVHAGLSGGDTDVAHLHGIYWTADYSADHWEWKSNVSVIEALRHAKEVTVPSAWVAETIQRDLRFTPHIIGHGIDWQDWQHNQEDRGYVLFNKNRAYDVCSPAAVRQLALRNGNTKFVTTFLNGDALPNVTVTGVVPHRQMKLFIQSCGIYLAVTKETFCIGVLEAMASGKPILGFAHGNVINLVQHGVNGYLAQPGNYDDLAAGLDYCQQHKKVLGENGRELAKQYTWQEACQKVAKVYELANKEEDVSVSIVIPVFNYEDKVGRAIESALAQSNPVKEIIVVDDGSTDKSAEIVKEYTKKNKKVRLIQKSNGGVATARNCGIEASTSKYICCLDADDAIDPRFIEALVPALEADRSLGIVYSGLHYILPDGREGDSQWPEQWDYNAQLQGRNQIPTASLFRKETWQRLGGYKQRCAPAGQGFEDADYHLRAGAYGWGAKKATDANLFLYSWQSGRYSGKSPKELNEDFGKEKAYYKQWYPWYTDRFHPLASLAKPTKMSHPVRQYDEPIISVIIPVGPGHEEMLIDALDSLEAQTFRKWEVIVVEDGNKISEKVKVAYPYVKWKDTDGQKGAGHARNLGVSFARASMLFYLDADDYLDPTCLEKMLNVWNEEGVAVYSNYYGLTILDKDRLDEAGGKVLQFDEKTGKALVSMRNADYDCERAIKQPAPDDKGYPYLWCNINTLFPITWHNQIGGFDENMETWEDWDYWIRMARAGKCFIKIEEPLVYYRFTTGSRRDKGLQNKESMIQYLYEKYRSVELMGCPGCGKRRSVSSQAMQSVNKVSQEGKAMMGQDEDFKLIRYTHQSLGEHLVIGASTDKDGHHLNYGMHAGGGKEKFLVHIEDIRANPQLFSIVEDMVTTALRADIGIPQPINLQPEITEEVKPEVKVVSPEVLGRLGIKEESTIGRVPTAPKSLRRRGRPPKPKNL